MTFNHQPNFSNPEEIKIPTITTLDGFIQRQNEIQKQVEAWVIKGWQHIVFLKRVLDFQTALTLFYWQSIDPIAYLHNLYFNENQSFSTIAITVKNIFEKTHVEQNIFKSWSAIQKFAWERLHWKLKNQKESKKTFTYMGRNQKEILSQNIQERKDQRKAEFLSCFIANTTPNFKDLDHDIFESFNFKYKKFIYLVANVFHISKENFLALQELSMWNQSLADRWNEQFENYKIDFQVSHKDIARAFEKLNHPQ